MESPGRRLPRLCPVADPGATPTTPAPNRIGIHMVVDVSPVIQTLVGLTATALGIIGSAVLYKLSQKLHLQISEGQQAAFDAALHKSLDYGATQATNVIAAHGWDHPAVKNEVVAIARQQAVAAFPGAPKEVGLSTDLNDPKNAGTLTAALERALPAAMTEASASPITPPTPASEAAPKTVVVNAVAATPSIK